VWGPYAGWAITVDEELLSNNLAFIPPPSSPGATVQYATGPYSMEGCALIYQGTGFYGVDFGDSKIAYIDPADLNQPYLIGKIIIDIEEVAQSNSYAPTPVPGGLYLFSYNPALAPAGNNGYYFEPLALTPNSVSITQFEGMDTAPISFINPFPNPCGSGPASYASTSCQSVTTSSTGTTASIVFNGPQDGCSFSNGSPVGI